MNYEKFKPFVKDFIKYYYDDLGHSAGGYLHIVLDDGNLEHEHIEFCRNECEKNKDTFGMFLAEILMTFTVDELEEMYNTDWWGMN